VALALVLLLLCAAAAGAALAQRPEAEGLEISLTFTRGGSAAGSRLSGTVVVRNNGGQEASFGAVTTRLPAGVIYIGQAVGSDLAAATVNGPEIRWVGPFSLSPGAELVVRYWAVASSERQPLPAEAVASAAILRGGRVLAEAEALLGSGPERAPAGSVTQPPEVGGQDAARPSALVVTKTADPAAVEPGRGVAYSVVFSNNSGDAVVLSAIDDLLPVPFEYVGLAVGSDVTQEPEDAEAPAIGWRGAFVVPARGVLTLRYWAWVPPETLPQATPYTNQATAKYGATTVGPARADVQVLGPDLQVAKTVSPTTVTAGEVVTYTVLLSNPGSLDGVIDTIVDTLPAGFAFVGMAPGSDILAAPAVAGNTLTWAGPLAMPAGATVKLVYQVRTAMVGGVQAPTNRVVAVAGGQQIGPAAAAVTVDKYSVFLPLTLMDYEPPRFTAAKTASPAEVKLGEEEPVVWTVRLRNEGDLPGVINTIVDTLPPGFSYQGRAPGSGVTSEPVVSGNTLTWTGPWTVGADSELVLAFKTGTPSTAGRYINQVTATTLTGAAPRQPGTATVNVKSPILLTSDFESGTEGWQPFLNLWRLNEEQWYWDPGYGYQGSNGYTFFGLAGIDPLRYGRGAHDALTMYMGEGSADWTDYRVRARFNWISGGRVGIWFRGTYQDSETPGLWTTGYYCVIRFKEGPGDYAELQQIRTEEEPGDETNPFALYKFDNPLDLQKAYLQTQIEQNQWHQITVEARGNNFKCWVDNELAIDYTDTEASIFLKGTVGLYTYSGDPVVNASLIQFDDVVVEPLD